MSREAIAAALARDDLPSGRAAGGLLAGQLRRQRQPCVAGRAGGRRACGPEPQPLPVRPRPPRPAWAGGRRGGRVGARAREHGGAAVRRRRGRGGRGRSTRSCSRRSCRAAGPAGLRGWCWRPWPRSPTSPASCGACRAWSCVRPQGVDDHTYRRARKELLESGELVLVHRACGRGNTNVWEVRPPGGDRGRDAGPGGRRGAWRRPQGRGRCSPPSPGRLRTRSTLTAALWRIQSGGVMATAARPPVLKTVLR